jgi:hypothetical protein
MKKKMLSIALSLVLSFGLLGGTLAFTAPARPVSAAEYTWSDTWNTPAGTLRASFEDSRIEFFPNRNYLNFVENDIDIGFYLRVGTQNHYVYSYFDSELDYEGWAANQWPAPYIDIGGQIHETHPVRVYGASFQHTGFSMHYDWVEVHNFAWLQEYYEDDLENVIAPALSLYTENQYENRPLEVTIYLYTVSIYGGEIEPFAAVGGGSLFRFLDYYGIRDEMYRAGIVIDGEFHMSRFAHKYKFDTFTDYKTWIIDYYESFDNLYYVSSVVNIVGDVTVATFYFTGDIPDETDETSGGPDGPDERDEPDEPDQWLTFWHYTVRLNPIEVLEIEFLGTLLVAYGTTVREAVDMFNFIHGTDWVYWDIRTGYELLDMPITEPMPITFYTVIDRDFWVDFSLITYRVLDNGGWEWVSTVELGQLQVPGGTLIGTAVELFNAQHGLDWFYTVIFPLTADYDSPIEGLTLLVALFFETTELEPDPNPDPGDGDGDGSVEVPGRGFFGWPPTWPPFADGFDFWALLILIGFVILAVATLVTGLKKKKAAFVILLILTIAYFFIFGGFSIFGAFGGVI